MLRNDANNRAIQCVTRALKTPLINQIIYCDARLLLLIQYRNSIGIDVALR